MTWIYLKAIHIIFVVTWFSGLFYIVRLFVYHAEASDQDEPKRSILQQQYKIMERRLWYGITWPSMIITLITGSWLALELYRVSVPSWLWLKLALVLGLVLYHLRCHALFKSYQNDKTGWSSIRLRMWNEVATLFLVAIVFIVVLKNILSFWWGLLGMVLFGLLLWLAIRIYKKSRVNKP
ncbi:MAG: CopD family protein [Flavobacteriales bacterium]|nr:CopD family protein [Flavobacteriales bacterium]